MAKIHRAIYDWKAEHYVCSGGDQPFLAMTRDQWIQLVDQGVIDCSITYMHGQLMQCTLLIVSRRAKLTAWPYAHFTIDLREIT